MAADPWAHLRAKVKSYLDRRSRSKTFAVSRDFGFTLRDTFDDILVKAKLSAKQLNDADLESPDLSLLAGQITSSVKEAWKKVHGRDLHWYSVAPPDELVHQGAFAIINRIIAILRDEGNVKQTATSLLMLCKAIQRGLSECGRSEVSLLHAIGYRVSTENPSDGVPDVGVVNEVEMVPLAAGEEPLPADAPGWLPLLHGTDDQRAQAMQALRDLVESSFDAVIQIQESGGLRSMVEVGSEGSQDTRTKAGEAMVHIIALGRPVWDEMVPLGVEFLSSDTSRKRRIGIALISQIAVFAELYKYANTKKDLVDAGVVPLLLRDLEEGIEAGFAILTLSVLSENNSAVEAEIVSHASACIPQLVQVLLEDPPDIVKAACHTLAVFAGQSCQNKDAIAEAGGVEYLAQLLNSTGARGVLVEPAIRALGTLACENEMMAVLVASADVVPQIVRHLLAGNSQVPPLTILHFMFNLVKGVPDTRSEFSQRDGVLDSVTALMRHRDQETRMVASYVHDQLSGGEAWRITYELRRQWVNAALSF